MKIDNGASILQGVKSQQKQGGHSKNRSLRSSKEKIKKSPSKFLDFFAQSIKSQDEIDQIAKTNQNSARDNPTSQALNKSNKKFQQQSFETFKQKLINPNRRKWDSQSINTSSRNSQSPKDSFLERKSHNKKEFSNQKPTPSKQKQFKQSQFGRDQIIQQQRQQQNEQQGSLTYSKEQIQILRITNQKPIERKQKHDEILIANIQYRQQEQIMKTMKKKGKKNEAIQKIQQQLFAEKYLLNQPLENVQLKLNKAYKKIQALQREKQQLNETAQAQIKKAKDKMHELQKSLERSQHLYEQLLFQMKTLTSQNELKIQEISKLQDQLYRIRLEQKIQSQNI